MPSDCGNGRLGLGLVGAISGSLGFLNFDFGWSFWTNMPFVEMTGMSFDYGLKISW